MSSDIQYPVRIPNLPMGRIVDANGHATDEELTFRQSLLTLLQQILGPEGLLMPSQSTSNINTIVDRTELIQGTATPTYTCLPGNLFYNSTNNTMELILYDNLTDKIPTRYLVTAIVI